MKRFTCITMLVLLAVAAHAQQTSQQLQWQANLTAQTTDCTVAKSCLTAPVNAANGGSTFTISGTFSATAQFEGSGDGAGTWVALNVTPSNSVSPVTSTTSAGTWQANIAGYSHVRVRVSTWASGTVAVTIQLSNSSARTGAAGGGLGSVTLSGTPSGAGEVPTTTSTTAATWQTPAGTGTVTNTAGNLTLNHVATGNAAADLTVDPTCVTDGAGGMTCTRFTGALTGNVTGNASGTAGSAAKWTTARNLAGNSVDGSANVAFSNKFVVQGTTDAGLSGAQFLGALSTGIIKNTTSTGVLSIAEAGDFPTLNQSTTGNAATATALASTPSLCSSNQAPTGVLAGGNATACTGYVLASVMTTIGDMLGGGASGAAARIVAGKTGQVMVATNGATSAFTSPGLADGNSGNAVTTTPYTVQCDSSTAMLDRLTTIRFQSGASVINLPDPTATGCTGNFAVVLIDDSAGTLTVNRGGSATLSVFGGASPGDGLTSFTLTGTQFVTVNNGASGIYEARITSGGGTGTVTTTGSPAQYQTAVMSGSTSVTGVVVGTSGYPFVSGGAGTYPSYAQLTGAGMVNNTVTATQLAAQYSKGSCTEAWAGTGTSSALTSGDDVYSNNTCYNDSGVTRTITAVKCRNDNASNTTTVNPTFGSAGTGTTILSGALPCGNSYAYSSSGTVSNASWTTGTGIDPAMSGTLTGTSIAMIVEYTF